MDPTQNNSFGGQQPMSMGYSGVPMSTGTGDIVLNNGGGKSKKGLLIGMIVVLIVVILGVVGVFFLTSNGGQKAKSIFSDLRQYLEEGDGGEWDEGDLIYAVSINVNSDESIADYYKVLMEKKESFITVKSGLDGNVLGRFESMINLLNGLINYRETKKQIIDKYKSDGLEDAKVFFDDNVECGQVGESLEDLCRAEMSYYDAELAEFAMYYDNECVKGEMFDNVCLRDKISNDEMIIELSEETASAERLFKAVRSDGWYKKVSDEVKKLDKEVAEGLGNA